DETDRQHRLIFRQAPEQIRSDEWFRGGRVPSFPLWEVGEMCFFEQFENRIALEVAGDGECHVCGGEMGGVVGSQREAVEGGEAGLGAERIEPIAGAAEQ